MSVHLLEPIDTKAELEAGKDEEQILRCSIKESATRAAKSWATTYAPTMNRAADFVATRATLLASHRL